METPRFLKSLRTFPLGRTFVKSLAVVLPAALTLWALWTAGAAAEAVLGGLLERLLPAGAYVRGMGIAGGLALVYAIGVLMDVWIARRLLEAGGTSSSASRSCARSTARSGTSWPSSPRRPGAGGRGVPCASSWAAGRRPSVS